MNLMNGSFTVTAPMFEGIHNHEKLLIVDFIIDICRLEFPQVKSYWVQFPFFVLLG